MENIIAKREAGGRIVAADEMAFNNYHKYVVEIEDPSPTSEGPYCNSFSIYFQKGPIKEKGTNGITEKDLLLILKNRIENFQKSEFASPYNDGMLSGILQALAFCDLRTQDRERRKVEGTNQK